ncbi:VanZ family protein [uncultured Agrococcus sp.]|uniref:VanZ family protein n=1 Tax=uncultured Agrococcus sp. TaxID=382258 RepID=UPI0025F357EB|nr:VanZ family protein [uncultured Agrococcus sp.]
MLNTYATTAGLAFLGAGFVAFVIALPYLIIHWRRTGTFGWGSTIILFGSIVYAFALAGYTMLPFPGDWAETCSHPMRSNLRPGGFVDDIRDALDGTSTASLRQVVAQLGLNVLLFIPLGVFVQQLVTKRWFLTVVAGAAVSLLIEVTQLTAAFGLFPCQWRVFDADDLIMNTAGAAIGALIAPVLRLLPGQPSTDRKARLTARPYTRWRSISAVLIDLLTIGFVPQFFAAVATVAARYVTGRISISDEIGMRVYFGVLLVTLAVQLVLVLARGTTVGEWVTWTSVTRVDGGRTGFWRRFLRFSTSILPAALWMTASDVRDALVAGGGVIAELVVDLAFWLVQLTAVPFAIAWVIVLFASHRTLTDVFARTRQVDARMPSAAAPSPATRAAETDGEAALSPHGSPRVSEKKHD